MKYIKLWEDHSSDWNWPEYSRLLELGLVEPDLFQCWTRIHFTPGQVPDKDALMQDLSEVAARSGVQCQGSHGTGQATGRFEADRLEYLWVGPVQGLKDWVEELRGRFQPWDRVVVRNWVRATAQWRTLEEREWWSWFQRGRGLDAIKESVDPAEQLQRLLDLGLIDPAEAGVKGLISALFTERYPDLQFEWSTRGEIRLKVSRPDGTQVSYLHRTANNPNRYMIVGDWLWKSSNRTYLQIHLTRDVVESGWELRQAIDVYRQSTPFLDKVYGGEKTGKDEIH